jgi:hypothetical protein
MVEREAVEPFPNAANGTIIRIICMIGIDVLIIIIPNPERLTLVTNICGGLGG